jgi:hypothetical protein
MPYESHAAKYASLVAIRRACIVRIGSSRALATILFFAAATGACSFDWSVEPLSNSDAAIATRLVDAGVLDLEPTLWLSADRGVVVDSMGQVESWRDRSGHAMNATAVTPDQRPTRRVRARTLPLIHFDGSDWLALPPLPPLRELSFFAVASAEEEDRLCPSILHFSNLVTPTVQAHDIEFGRHSRELYYENTIQYVPDEGIVTNTFSTGRLHVLSIVHSSELVVTLHVNGDLVHRREQMVRPERVERTANFIGHNHFYHGNTALCVPYLGDIAEVIFFSRVVDRAERSAIEQYLSEKWAVPLSQDR